MEKKFKHGDRVFQLGIVNAEHFIEMVRKKNRS